LTNAIVPEPHSRHNARVPDPGAERLPATHPTSMLRYSRGVLRDVTKE
jgi:hypothetical protein